MADYSFPQLPGSHLAHFSSGPKPADEKSGKRGARAAANPVLELVKSLMQVLSLDKNITLEARLLRKELLAMFDVREFSKEGAFQNPPRVLGSRS